MILLKKIVESAVFRNAVFAVVLLNVVLLGVQCSAEWNQTAEIYLSRGLEACLAFFVVETVLKLVALRGNYFKNRWNCLDFAIVLASILAEMSGISSLRVLRLLRSALALKIFNGNGNIQRDLFSIFQSVPRIMGTMLLLLVIFFIFSVAGVAFFGEDFPELFGNLGHSMLTLFLVMIFESWQTTSVAVIEKYPSAALFFIPFVFLTSFILMNIIVGIIVDATSSAARFRSKDAWLQKNFHGQKSELRDHIAKFQKYLNQFYEECDQSLIKISKDCLAESLKAFGKTQDDINVDNKMVQRKMRGDGLRYIYFALPDCDKNEFRIHIEWPMDLETLAQNKELDMYLHFEGKDAVSFERENHITFEKVASNEGIERFDEGNRISYGIHLEFVEKCFLDMTESERRRMLTNYYRQMGTLIQKVYASVAQMK